MRLDPQFKEFIRSIKPTDRQQEDWKTGAKTLRNRLAADDDLKNLVVATFLQGSIRRATAVRPSGEKRPDVDIVVVTNIDHQNVTPEEAMNLFKPFLDRYYEGKWRLQGRSFGVSLSYVDMDLVITSLPSLNLQEMYRQHTGSINERDELVAMYQSDAINTLATLEEDTSWRLNTRWQDRPVHEELGMSSRLSEAVLNDAPPADWKEKPLFLPDLDSQKWGRTHPLLQISWTAEKNRKTNLTYLNIVRALKWWRLEKLPKYPKGYPLEHMIGHHLNDGADLSTAYGVVQVFEHFRDLWRPYAEQGSVPCLTDHGVEEHNVLARLDPEDFQNFYNVISEYAALAREAYDCDDAANSGQLWQKVFGGNFPLPGPSGGDRMPGQFAGPGGTMPAVPKAERFA